MFRKYFNVDSRHSQKNIKGNDFLFSFIRKQIIKLSEKDASSHNPFNTDYFTDLNHFV